MSLPGNGIFVVQGEMAMLVTAMRRSTRWGSHSFPNDEYDVLMRTFQDLKNILNHVDDLRLLDPSTYLSPFLEVIRSKETTGPVTSSALSAVNKFLSYGLIDPTHPSVPATVEDIADAVTHARFVGTDHSSDGVVLMKILQVLRTLMLSPEGALLTDESVCEIMLSCFRICFESRLTELLRRNAEQCLRDMTQLVFMRIPQFPPEDIGVAPSLCLKKREGKSKRRSLHSTASITSLDRKSPTVEQAPSPPPTQIEPENDVEKLVKISPDKNLINEAEITIEPVDQMIKSPNKTHTRHSSMDLAANTSITQLLEKCVSNVDGNVVDGVEAEKKDEEKAVEVESPETDGTCISKPLQPEDGAAETVPAEEYVNPRGVRFTQQEETVVLQPYGLPSVRELFRFLISLCNPLDSQNTSGMVHLGLSLVSTALEVGADHVANYPSLLYLAKDPLCRNLLSLLDTEKISIFDVDLQVTFLLFEALRFHLKFQMEAFFKKIIEIISNDTSKSIYELKEIQHLSLEFLSQLFRIPGICMEMFLNFDCDIYCMNIFEEITKLLSKNVVSSTAHNIHSLSLEALMTIIEAVESGSCQKELKMEADESALSIPKETRSGQVCIELGGLEDLASVNDHVTHDISQYYGGGRANRYKNTAALPTEAELDNIKNLKKWVIQGTELFNQKSERGIEFLQEHGVLKNPLDPDEVAMFLRENPDLDKKMIGEYICKRSSRDEEDGYCVLGAFANSFDYTGLRIDQSLRQYLETFRLPGEAPLIFLLMERFAHRWHTTNGEPFANTDAAFRLAYAIIMLNMDQHNHNAKKLNIPMRVEDFVKNLRGCNGTGDFEKEMLKEIYQAIKDEEMVMPAERLGLVRDAYLWRVLQRRGRTAAGHFRSGVGAGHLHASLFRAACPSTVTALSAAFERSPAPPNEEVQTNSQECAAFKALNGLERCAALVARFPPDGLTLDTIVLTLCKFTGLLTPQYNSYIGIGVPLGQSFKAQAALRRACAVLARHSECARAAWRHLAEALCSLHTAKLLPQSLVEVEDYLAPEGKVSLIRDVSRGSEAGLLSSLYSYIALGESTIRAPTPQEKLYIDLAAECVAKCNLESLLITETKFMPVESLQELVRAMITVGAPPDAESLQMNPQLEDNTIFFMELLGKTLIQNRDRLEVVWLDYVPYSERCLGFACARSSATCARVLTCLVRTCARLMRCEGCAPSVLAHLRTLFALPRKVAYKHSVLVTHGLYELVKTSAQNVHSASDWDVVFSLLCAFGAGAWPKHAKPLTSNTASSRSECSEDDSDRRPTSVSSESELSHSPQTQGWILVKNAPSPGASEVVFRGFRWAALWRCLEALALVVRDVAHVTPHNAPRAAAALRAAARAAVPTHGRKEQQGRKSRGSRRRDRDGSSDDDDEDATDELYDAISMQLLDLMHTLHSRTAQIFKWWKDEADGGAEDYDLWEIAWRPLLQGIARFCTDKRKVVANSAKAYLQRALLAPGMSNMGGARWADCFYSVLFPLLDNMPTVGHRADLTCRANTILCKVFLHHLSALASLATFGALWSRVIDLQRSMATATGDEPLAEAAMESLKNMILVMDSLGIFSDGDNYNALWYTTWEKIGEFLPNLKEELFPQAKDNQSALPRLLSPTQAASASNPTQPTSTPTILSNPLIKPIPISPNAPLINLNPVCNPPSLIPLTPSIIAQNSTFIPLSTPSVVPPRNQAYNPQLSQNSAIPTASLVNQSPVSGMVPIRNPLYDQTGLTSSVLLQPLNEMVSTPIGLTLQSQMPMLYPRTSTEALQPHFVPHPIIEQRPIKNSTSIYENNVAMPDNTRDLTHSELYTEYITNPYTETEDLSEKEATLYDPESLKFVHPSIPTNPLLSLDEKQKSLSENTTPMHNKNRAQFGSSDNVSSGMFNFSSYFGAGGQTNVSGSEVFDTLMSTHDG